MSVYEREGGSGREGGGRERERENECMLECM